jgi:hypothetical protein
MYMFDRVLKLFELAAIYNGSIRLLVITRDTMVADRLIKSCLKAELHASVHVHSAERKEVPVLVSAMDILVSFIQPSYARLAASPTKMAECFAAGIPVICNDGVGDVSEHVRVLDAGIIVDPNSDVMLSKVVTRLDDIVQLGGARLREASRRIFGLEVAHAQYRMIYRELD